MTSETQKIELVETRVEDHLDEDKPIRGQKYVLLSFISPEDAIINKDVLYFSKFIESFSNNVKDIFNNIKDKYPESKDLIDNVMENHKYILDANELNEQYKFFKSVNNEDLENKYAEKYGAVTSIRGVKVRGSFETIEEAKIRSEFLKKLGDKFHIYVAEVGCWCAWSPDPEFINNIEYSNTQLNTLMKEYKQNMEDKDALFESRKLNSIQTSIDAQKNQTPVDAINEENEDITDTTVNLSSIKEVIENVDVWSERKNEENK